VTAIYVIGMNRIVCNISIVVLLSFALLKIEEMSRWKYSIISAGGDDERKGYLQNSVASYKSSDVTVLVGRVGSSL